MAKASLDGLIRDLRGTIGNEVMTRGRTGEIVRRRPRYNYPTRPIQQAQQDRMKVVMAVWNTLTYSEAMVWNTYAQSLTRIDPITGATYHPTGQNVFVGLANKFLQHDPTGSVPLAPPAATFAGDTPVLTLSGQTGAITFAATGPNTSGVVTELLLQKLKSPRRSPTTFYKSLAFAVFTPGALDHTVTTEPGHYAGAYRFVRADTGQMSEMVTLAVVEVG